VQKDCIVYDPGCLGSDFIKQYKIIVQTECKNRISFTSVRIINVITSVFLLFFSPDNDALVFKHVESTKKSFAVLIKNTFIGLLTEYNDQQRK